jgi:hypothetical protein
MDGVAGDKFELLPYRNGGNHRVGGADRAADAFEFTGDPAGKLTGALVEVDHLFCGEIGSASALANGLSRGSRSLRSSRPASFAWDGPVIFDVDRSFQQRFGAGADCLHLVRPDGYVGYRSQPADAGKLWAYLDRLFLAS